MEKMREKSMMTMQQASGAPDGSGADGVPEALVDPTTYDPTQGTGSSAWQQSLAMNARLNAQRRRGAH